MDAEGILFDSDGRLCRRGHDRIFCFISTRWSTIGGAGDPRRGRGDDGNRRDFIFSRTGVLATTRWNYLALVGRLLLRR